MISEETSAPRPPFLNRITARQRVAIDTVVGLLLFVGGLGGLHAFGGRLPGHFALLVIALALATLPLPLRNRSPLSVLALVATGLVVGTLLKQGLAGTPVVAMAMFSVATHLRRRESLLVALGTAFVFGIALAVAGFHIGHGDNTPFYDATDNILAIAVAWFIGESVRARRAYVTGSVLQAEQRQRLEAERAQISLTEERLHIARELHDIVAHTLSVIAIQSGVGRHVLDTQPEEARKALAAIETTSRSALNDLRWVLGVLRSDDGEGPARDPAPGLSDVERLLEESRAAGLDVSFTAGRRREAPLVQHGTVPLPDNSGGAHQCHQTCRNCARVGRRELRKRSGRGEHHRRRGIASKWCRPLVGVGPRCQGTSRHRRHA